jgi:hypothetical protein
VDGRSALRSTVAAQRHRRIIAKKFRHSYLVDTPSFASDRGAALARKEKLFGSGVYRLGPRPDLLGRRLEGMHALPRGQEHALIAGAERYRNVEPSTGFLPTHVVGRISGARRRSRRIVALAVNGRIAATGLTFRLRGSKDEQFSLLMPERALRPGENRLELALVAAHRLRRLGGSR